MGPALLLLAATAMKAGGEAWGGMIQAQESKTQEAMAKYNAMLALQEAGQIRKATKFQRVREREAGARSMSTMRAQMGMSGARSDVGTALLVAGEAAKEIELNDLLLAYEGEISARRKESEAAMTRMQAKIYGKRAQYQRTAGFIGAGTTLLQGFGSYKTGGY